MRPQSLSVWIAMRCREPEFQRFLQVSTEEAAAAVVRTRCGVQSRRQFDTDPAAAQRLHQLIRIPYSEFHHNQEPTHA